ncbi:N-6 DNA methylase [Micromonospora tulbaghiae]|uniref:N-6 DNA methylase n=1 Tax=Micromonospora tulbaghiae TaxID=479978 RepID=UPI0033E7E8E2
MTGTEHRRGRALAGATVTTSDIARLADVGRAAVSNWRRRFPDFPVPVGGSSASPHYALADVEAWLIRHQKPFRLRPVDRVWQALRGAADDLQLGDRIGYLGLFLVLLERDPSRWRALAGRFDAAVTEELTHALGALVPEAADLVTEAPDRDGLAIVRLTADATEHADHRVVFDFLCHRYREVHSRRHTDTPQAYAELMVAVTAPYGRVLDPACGLGTLLSAAQRAGASELWGRDASVTEARLTAARLLLHGGLGRVTAAEPSGSADSAPGLADAVICDPPPGERPRWHTDAAEGGDREPPPRGEPELAWVQHCLSQVRPGGHVAILMPPAAATRRAGRRVRAGLLRAGALRAVAALPSAGPAGAAAPDLWVLRRPDGGDQPAHLLVVDATDDLGAAERAWTAFRTGNAGLPDRSLAVPIVDLLDDDVDVNPGRWLVPAGSPTDYRPAWDRMEASLAGLTSILPELRADPPTGAGPTVTVGELARAGALTIRQAPPGTAVVDAGPLTMVTSQDIRQARSPSGRAHPLHGAISVRAGDVVTPLAPRAPAVRVMSGSDVLLGPRLYLLRVDPEQVDAYFLAGFLRIAQHPAATGSASLAVRSDIRRVRLPRLPLGEQRAYGEAFRRLMAFEDGLRELVELGEGVVEQAFRGLGDGSLRSAVSDD